MVKRKAVKSRKTKGRKLSGKWLGIGQGSSNVVEGEVIREIPKGEKRKKSSGEIAAQKRLAKERKTELAERERQAEVLKFHRKAEVEEAKGRFLKATAKKRAYRRVATRLHPLGGIAGTIGGAGKSLLTGRKDKKRKIGW